MKREFFSGQKKIALYKPFLGVTTNGKIVSVSGPHKANDGDAEIIEKVFSKDASSTSMFNPGDIFLIDRGVKRSFQFLENDIGFDVYMPAFLVKGEIQLSFTQANWSRLCTKHRGVVERVFGHLQGQFEHFAQPIHNKSLPHDFQDLLNSCAILNAYFPRLTTDSEFEAEISTKVLSRLNIPNHLSEFVDKKL